MRSFLWSLIITVFGVFPAYADDQTEIAKVSVRLFHEICMGSITNPDKTAEIMAQFNQLPEDKAALFRKNLEASEGSTVTAFNFPKANFVSVIDPKKGKCDVVGDKKIRFEDVKAEFDEAVKGFSSVDGVKVTEMKTDNTSLMSSLRYSYDVPAKNISFGIFASAKNGEVAEGQMAMIYTMFVKPIESNGQ